MRCNGSSQTILNMFNSTEVQLSRGPIYMSNILYFKKIINDASSVWLHIIVHKHDSGPTVPQKNLTLASRTSSPLNFGRHLVMCAVFNGSNRIAQLLWRQKHQSWSEKECSVFFSVMNRESPLRVILVKSLSGGREGMWNSIFSLLLNRNRQI